MDDFQQGQDMYLNPEIARLFAKRQENYKHERRADILDRVIMHELKDISGPIHAAELGAGAHTDRYHRLFGLLQSRSGSQMDWVDYSPPILELAQEYISIPEYEARKKNTKFIQKEIINYLKELPEETLDIAIMKYSIGCIKDLNDLFDLLKIKLKQNGRFVVDLGDLSNELKSISNNARFLYRGEEFPENETRKLEEGELYGIKFFNETDNPDSGYLEGAETQMYYHSKEKLIQLGAKHGFEVFLDSWKNLLSKEEQVGEDMKQIVLVLKKI